MDFVELRSERRLWRFGQVVLALAGAVALVLTGDWALGFLVQTPTVREVSLFFLPSLASVIVALYGMHRIQRRLEGPLSLPG